MQWTGSARDHGTFCVSCHTAMPYALSRPALRNALAETGPSEDEQRLIENVTKRVRLWKDIGPYYSGAGYNHKTAESRGTEAVLNALILASHDAQNGTLSSDTRDAFNNMWALQQTAGDDRGSWLWLQFDQEPWEANDSAYYGAALAAIAVGTAPGNYASDAEIQAHVASLRQYLTRESARAIRNQSRFPALGFHQVARAPSAQPAASNHSRNSEQATGRWRMEIGFHRMEMEWLERSNHS